MGVLIFYNVFSTKVWIKVVHDPSVTTYRELQASYPSTLKCSCSRTTVPYGAFSTLTPTFHQICSSDLVSDLWISILADRRIHDSVTDTWLGRSTGYFRLLTSLCRLSNTTAADHAHRFLAQTLATSYVLTETDFRTQSNKTFVGIIRSMVISFNLLIGTMRFIMYIDQPVVIWKNSQIFSGPDLEADSSTHGISSKVRAFPE